MRSPAIEALDALRWKPGNDEAAARYWIGKHDWDRCAAVGRAAIIPLSQELQSHDRSHRRKIISTLGNIGGTHALKALFDAYEGTYDGYWEEAVHAIRRIKIEADALPVLASVLADPKANRWLGAQILGEIRLPQVVDILVPFLSDERIREAVAKALRSAQWVPPKSEEGALYWIGLDEPGGCAAIGVPAVLPLLGALKKDGQSFVTAARTLGKIGDRRAVQPLIQALKKRQKEFREAASEALGEIGDPEAVTALAEALRDEEYAVSWAAADALAKIGTPAMLSVRAASKDANKRVRISAVRTLGKMGEASIESLISLLRDNEREVREEAIRGLGQIRDARGVEPLITVLQDSDWHMRQAAVHALGTICDKRAVEPLIAAIKDNEPAVRHWVFDALGKIGDKRAVEPLLAALEGNKWDRKAVVEALGTLRDVRALAPLIPLLQDGDIEVRLQAGEAVAKLGYDRGIDTVVEILKAAFLETARATQENLYGAGSASTRCKIAISALVRIADANPSIIRSRWRAIAEDVQSLHRDFNSHRDESQKVIVPNDSNDCTHSETRHEDEHLKLPVAPAGCDF
jgi:HEAT repeat protein